MSHVFTITISDDEYKAFELMIEDPDAWVLNAARNKIRKVAIRVAEMHAEDPTRWLTSADIAAIKAVMEANGDIMKEPRNWSNATLRAIIQRTSMPTRAERELANLPTP